MISRPVRWQWAALLLLAVCALASPVARACTTGACVSAGPRLADVDTNRSALLNLMLGGLTGSSLSLSVLDWRSIAQGEVELVRMLDALQTTLNVSTPSAALITDASVAQLVGAAATAANARGDLALAGSLNTLAGQVALLPGTIRLGDLLSITGAVGETRLNALDLVSGMLQLYNRRNVATTPAPVTVSGTNVLGLTGVNAVRLWAQVVEPPVYVCGPTGSQFHSAAIRVKLEVTLVPLSPSLTDLLSIPTVSAASLSLTSLGLYVEIARGNGTITGIDALTNALTVQATPGVADVYLGTISDSLFFTRTRAVNPATDLTPVSIGGLSISITVPIVGTTTTTTAAIRARSVARGQAPFTNTLSFAGPYPQTRTASSSTSSAANLAASLITNLELSTSPDLGPALNALVLAPVKTLTTGLLQPLLSTLLTGLADPLLQVLGVRIGIMEVTAGGAFRACSIAGAVYADANHSAAREYPEGGTGLTLYAKLVPTPGTAPVQAVAVDAISGAFSFSHVTAGRSYRVLIDTSVSRADIDATLPAGWIATEVPGMTRSFTLGDDRTDQTFGLYNGSRVDGMVFRDDGAGGGTPHNILKETGEAALTGIALRLTNASGATTYDTTLSGAGGSYTLWAPAAAGGTLRIAQTNAPGHVSVGGRAGNTGGSYDRGTDAVTFTHAAGSTYSGVHFADVAANAFLTDGQQTVSPGGVAFYTHAFIAGTAGQVAFSGATTPLEGWAHLFYRDADCNGRIDGADALLSGTSALTAGEKLCVIVKVDAAENAPFDTRYPLTVTATFTYANIGLNDSQARNDLTLVSTGADTGLRLVKSVDRALAKPGEVLTYSVAFRNDGNAPLTTLRIRDATPAFTVFNAASCGALPAGATGCEVRTRPAAGATGSIEWVFDGMLMPGAGSTVTFTVTLR